MKPRSPISSDAFSAVNNSPPSSLIRQPQSLTSLEKNLFPSLEASDGHKVDEEFDKLTNESRLDSLLTKETSKLDELLDDSNHVPLSIDKVNKQLQSKSKQMTHAHYRALGQEFFFKKKSRPKNNIPEIKKINQLQDFLIR